MLKEILHYVRKYGLGRLVKKAPGRIYRTFRPLLHSAGLIKDNIAPARVGISCFYVPQLPPRLNLVMSGQDVSADKTDGIIYMVVNLADRTGYGLRIISASPLNTLKFSRLLKATGLRTGNIEFTSFETARSNSEIDIGPLDVFICCSADAMDRIIDCINARNIFLIAPEQISQAASSDVLKKLLQQITQVITSLQSGGHHVRP